MYNFLDLIVALIIFLLALLCCYALHINMETMLRLVGQDPRVARSEITSILRSSNPTY